MSHDVVKLIKFEDGACSNNDNEDDFNSWHFVYMFGDSPRFLCDGLAFEDETEYKEKSMERGGVTCKKCLLILKGLKAVKL